MGLRKREQPSKQVDDIYSRVVRASIAVNAKDTMVLGSNPASSDTVEFKGRQMKQCRIKSPGQNWLAKKSSPMGSAGTVCN